MNSSVPPSKPSKMKLLNLPKQFPKLFFLILVVSITKTDLIRKMKHISSLSKISSILMVFIVITSFHAFGQESNKIITYDTPEHMVAAAKEVITEIPVQEFRDIYNRDNIFIIDVRTVEEYKNGAVPGAVNIPRGVLEFRIGTDETWESAGMNPPKKEDPIIVYCGTGARGALSAKSLMQLGYTNIKSVEGGWGELKESLKSD